MTRDRANAKAPNGPRAFDDRGLACFSEQYRARRLAGLGQSSFRGDSEKMEPPRGHCPVQEFRHPKVTPDNAIATIPAGENTRGHLAAAGISRLFGSRAPTRSGASPR